MDWMVGAGGRTDVGATHAAAGAAAQYLRWSDDRVRRAVALLERVPRASPPRVVEPGCGTGTVAALLRGRRPGARAGRWRDRLETLIRPEPTKPPEYYWDLLAPRVSALEVWETVYTQALTGDNPVADFVKGSWLKPFLDALDSAERPAFESAYRSRVARAYPPRADGTTLFPFRRLFIVARC